MSRRCSIPRAGSKKQQARAEVVTSMEFREQLYFIHLHCHLIPQSYTEGLGVRLRAAWNDMGPKPKVEGGQVSGSAAALLKEVDLTDRIVHRDARFCTCSNECSSKASETLCVSSSAQLNMAEERLPIQSRRLASTLHHHTPPHWAIHLRPRVPLDSLDYTPHISFLHSRLASSHRCDTLESGHPCH